MHNTYTKRKKANPRPHNSPGTDENYASGETESVVPRGRSLRRNRDERGVSVACVSTETTPVRARPELCVVRRLTRRPRGQWRNRVRANRACRFNNIAYSAKTRKWSSRSNYLRKARHRRNRWRALDMPTAKRRLTGRVFVPTTRGG